MNQIHVSFLNLDKLNGIETFLIPITVTSGCSLMTETQPHQVYIFQQKIDLMDWVNKPLRNIFEATDTRRKSAVYA
jgi:hypothetical protein